MVIMVIAKSRLMDSIVKGEYSLELFKKDLSCFIDSINEQFDDMIIPALPIIDTPMDLVRKVESMDSLQEEYLLSYSNLSISLVMKVSIQASKKTRSVLLSCLIFRTTPEIQFLLNCLIS